nr:PREDICTED: uncharacterized protein LOC108225691 [Daucus carota subsp. sativus]
MMINLSRQRLDISHEQARHSICDGADSLCWESESRCQLQQICETQFILIMRFKPGSKVEVLKEVDSLTAWCGGEIISGKGHSYTVRYDHYVPEHGEATDRVHEEFVRPPPPIQRVDSWVSDDVVEVFDDVMWRTAIISSARGSYCNVRLLGSSYKFRVHISNIRIRQSWKNDKWLLMDKVISIISFSKYV